MFPENVEYQRADSINEAIELLEENPAGGTELLAGGQSLIPIMKQRMTDLDILVDIGRIEELQGIEINDETISIGPLATHHDLCHSSLLEERAHLLHEAAAAVGDLQVRNRGTIGGNLAHADPASDLPAAVLALGGMITVQGSSKERSVSADEFFQGLFGTDLGESEIITRIDVPALSAHQYSAYVKHANQSSGHAVVGVAAIVEVEDGTVTDARIAANGVTGRPVRLNPAEDTLEGQKIEEDLIGDASEEATEGIDSNEVIEDIHTSADFRIQLLKTYTRRVLNNIMERI